MFQARPAITSPTGTPAAAVSAKASATVFAAANAPGEFRRRAGLGSDGSQRVKVSHAALGMNVEQALRELGHLGDAAGDRHARHGMIAKIFQHAAYEIAHVDELYLVQAVEFLHGGLGSVAGGAGDVGEPHGAGDVDTAMDGVNPGRARVRDDDAGGAEDGDAVRQCRGAG